MNINITVYKGCLGDWYVSFNDRYSPTFRLSVSCRNKKDAEHFAREFFGRVYLGLLFFRAIKCE